MADTAKQIMSVIATTSGRLPDLTIQNGQLIFIQDLQRIALDFNGTRIFYNQIIILETESERQELTTPVNGLFYFVISTAILWMYQDDWVQITTPSKEVIFIGTILPELGSEDNLYIDKANKNISVWDTELQSYVVVADKTELITDEDIDALFII